MSLARLCCGAGALLALLAPGERAAAQTHPRFSVHVAGAAEQWRPVVEAEGLLRDGALRRALESGLPLRFRLRVELWEKRLFDRLVDTDEVFVALTQEPLEHAFLLDSGQGARRLTSLPETERALSGALRAGLRPARAAGRFYYLAVLEVETLSLSDLDELRRWLRGDVRPAVEGRRSAERALESGLRRVLVRVIGLPTRRYEARSTPFTPQP